MSSVQSKRGEERVNAALPVQLHQFSGVTRDVSASGICFEVDVAYDAGSEISFVIELDTSEGKMLLNCKGSVVRTEDHGSKKAVAVKLSESVLKAAN
jgi:hypothetical protein